MGDWKRPCLQAAKRDLFFFTRKKSKWTRFSTADADAKKND
jgi:hypothetical protein